ncbi:MAG: hypothetical protein ACUVUR_06250 [bacterium]
MGSESWSVPVAGRFFVRVKTQQPVWQFFPPFDKRHKGFLEVGLDVAELICRHPDFLNFDDRNTPPFRVALPFAKQTGMRSRVLVAVNEGGGIFIVGCPDEAKPDAYTTIIADILALGTKLWRMSYEQFSELFVETEGGLLEELMLERSRANWDFDRFRPAVVSALERGRFPIIIVTADPTGNVQQVVAYLSGMNLTVLMVGYSVWSSGGIIIIEPLPVKGSSATKSEATTTFEAPSSSTEAGLKPQNVEQRLAERVEEQVLKERPVRDVPLGSLPTEPAKKVAKPVGPGTKPGVMSGKRPPPKPRNDSERAI